MQSYIVFLCVQFQDYVSDSDAVNTEPDEISDRDISNAFCSLAEIYLTDCWYETIFVLLGDIFSNVAVTAYNHFPAHTVSAAG